MSQTASILRLPNEVLHMILSRFDPIDLTELELVCRKWYEASRSGQTLWRDAMCGYGLVKPTKEGDKLLSALLERGGGKLNDLAVEIDTSECNLQGVRKFCRILESSDVQNLWLEISWTMKQKPGSVSGRTMKVRYGKAVNYILASIAQCSNLKSLHIETLGIKNERIQSDIASFPLANCKLERLTLNCVKFDSLLENGLFLRMLEKARAIELENEAGAISEEDAIRLLEHTKDTLKECHLDIKEQFTFNNPPSRAIKRSVNLPNVFRFFLSITNPMNRPDEQIHDTQQTKVFQDVSFNCPKLSDVYLEGRIPPNVYANFLTENIEALYLNFLHPDHLPERDVIQKCVKLKRLIVQNIGTMSFGFVIDLILSTSKLELRELIIEEDENYPANEIIATVRLRQEKLNGSRLYLFYLHGKPHLTKENLNWLIGNFPDFLPAHPYIWENVLKCSSAEIEKYINIEPFYSRSHPMLLKRGSIDWPIGFPF